MVIIKLPQICFDVDKTRHNTRFFIWGKQSNQNKIFNQVKINSDLDFIFMFNPLELQESFLSNSTLKYLERSIFIME